MKTRTIIFIIIAILVIAVIIRLNTNEGKLMENYEYPHYSTKLDPVCEDCKTLYNKCTSENPIPYLNVNNPYCDTQMGYYSKCFNCDYTK